MTNNKIHFLPASKKNGFEKHMGKKAPLYFLFLKSTKVINHLWIVELQIIYLLYIFLLLSYVF